VKTIFYNKKWLLAMMCLMVIVSGFPGYAPSAWAQSPPAGDTDSENAVSPVIAEAPENDATATVQPEEKSSGMGKLVFNFDNAELAEVIRTLADLLRINYMLDPAVGGKVTIHTAGELDQNDLFPIFYQILEVNGVTAIKRDNIYHLVPMKDAARLPITSRMNRTGKIPAGDRVVIQVIRLKSVSAQEIAKVLTPFVSAEGSIVTQENTNLLVAVDKADNIAKILRLVDVFDSDIFDRVNYRFYPLQYGDVETMVETMDKVFTAYGPSTKAGMTFIPIVRLNTLLAVGSQPKAFDAVEKFLKQYDVPSQSTEPSIYFYPVRNGQASDIAGILNQVFTGGKKEAATDKKKSQKTESSFRNPLSRDAKYKKQETDQRQKPPAAKPSLGQSAGGAGGDSFGSGTLNGEVRITEDEARNSLVIEAAPADYQIIKNLLTKLDILPRQVLIEMMIAEIGLDEASRLGVSWKYNKEGPSMDTSLISAKINTTLNPGMEVLVGNPDRWSATLNALATENRVNILSTPRILASNSLPATIDISQEIPITTTQYQYTDTGNSDLLETSIEYRDTGLLLTVTPNINEQGLVTMEISQEISELGPNIDAGNSSYPSFYKRATDTTLTVQSGQTIVIGGIIRESKNADVAGTPWLVTLPVVGWLFGTHTDASKKTELIIMISPYVLDDFDDVDAVTQEFKKKAVNLFPEAK